MGSFYTNFTVKNGNAQAVAEVLRRAGRTAILAPAENGFVVVYDMECENQDPAEMEQVGKMLSESLGNPVLGVLNHDDDVLLLILFDGGEVVDDYNSCPAYFGEEESEEPVGGDSKLLCETLSSKADPADVDRILRETEEYVFASERHQALVSALGLSGAAVSTGYNYIEQDELPDGIDPSDLIRVR